MPAPSVRPQPWTVKAPAATSNAPYRTSRWGRRPSSRGTSTATTTGAQPTKTPGTAGSAVRSAASTARLKPTMPTAASSASRPHWRGVEAPQRRRAAPADQRQQQQAGEAVAQELAARVRVVAQDAVGGEGGADEDTGEGGEQGPSDGGGVHGRDAMKGGGPV